MRPYPNALEIDHMTASLLKGGSRHEDTYATRDDYDTVVAWYDAHYGHCRVMDEARAVWQDEGRLGMITQLTVVPMTQAWLPLLAGLDASVQFSLRTVITVTCLFPPRPWWRFWRA